MKKTSRNFVFLTLILTILTAIQFPQKESAQTITGEFAIIESTSFAQPSEEISSTKQSINNSIEKLDDTRVSDSKSDVSLKSASASIPFTATAYCLNGRTASGGSVRRGVIAADPRVLPLGTRVQINAGAWSGTYTVSDTGGGVRGRKIDVWVPNSSEARRFGRRSVSVTVLK